MVGCKLIVISGIDGNLKDFVDYIEPLLKDHSYQTIQYNRILSFKQNIELMRSVIISINQECCLFGWSIGAVAASFLADCENVKVIIMINAFFNRSYVLKLRNILCDEEVSITETKRQEKRYIIIAGKKDDKIPYSESIKIANYYKINAEDTIYCDNAKHNLSSFPKQKIASLINKILH